MKEKFEILDFYYLRSPLLPFHTIPRLCSASPNAPREVPQERKDRSAALAEELNLIEERLHAFLQQPRIREALYLASPSLLDALEKRYRVDIPDHLSAKKRKKALKDQQKLSHALLRYLSRMSYRCTPYGLFAGCTLGTFAQDTAIQIRDFEHHQMVARIDMELMSKIADKLAQIPKVRQQIRYFPNTSLYQIPPQKLRYAQYTLQDKGRQYILASVDQNEYLAQLLEKAGQGATLSELSQALIQYDTTILLEEAEAFILEVIEEQILVSELEPNLTGPDYLLMIQKIFNKYQDCEDIQELLTQLTKLLSSVSPQDPPQNLRRYAEVAAALEAFDIPVVENRFIQVDYFKTCNTNTLSHRVKKSLRQILALLGHWSQAPNQTRIKQFKDQFATRYGEQPVPLVEALGPEAGLAYGSATSQYQDLAPLLRDIPIQPLSASLPSEVQTAFARLRRKKLLTWLKSSQGSLTLTDQDLANIPQHFQHSPASFNIMGRLIAEEDQTLFFVSAAGGTASATQILGRFTAGDEALKEKISELNAREAAIWGKDALLAEIIHLPEARIGNILFRENISPFEIPYLAQSSLPPEQQIEVNDLDLCMKDGHLILVSRSRKKRVIPRLSSAHNYPQTGLPIYIFLADFAQQYTWQHPGIWNWGMFGELEHLPRVTYKNLILAPASWRIQSNKLPPNKSLSLSEIAQFVQELRQKLKLPRFVVWAQGDNKLLIDFDNILFCQFFVTELKKQGSLALQEALIRPEQLLVNGPEGTYTHELVFSVARKEAYAIDWQPEEGLSEVQRSFLPGDSWFYLKIYCGTKFADFLLNEILAPLCREMIQEGLVSSWFFIRFNDPDPHLRIRFFNHTDPLFYEAVYRRVCTACQSFLSNRIYKIVIDTYDREIDRYGGKLIQIAEKVFYYDSVCTSEVLSLLEGDQGNELRAILAIKGVDLLLEGLMIPPLVRLSKLESIRDAFFQEFAISKQPQLRIAIDKKFEAQKEMLYRLIYHPEAHFSELTEVLALFAQRTEQIQTLIKQAAIDPQSPTWTKMIGSYLHMFLNRFFRSRHREQETIVYHYLYKTYLSHTKRQSNSAQT